MCHPSSVPGQIKKYGTRSGALSRLLMQISRSVFVPVAMVPRDPSLNYWKAIQEKSCMRTTSRPHYAPLSYCQPHPWLDSKNMVCWEFSAFPFVHDWLKMVGSRRCAIQGKNKNRRLHANPSQSLGCSHSNQGILLVLLTQTLTSHGPSIITWQPTEGSQEYPHVPRSFHFGTQCAGAFIQVR